MRSRIAFVSATSLQLLSGPYGYFRFGVWGGSYCCEPAESSSDRHCAKSAIYEYETREKE